MKMICLDQVAEPEPVAEDVVAEEDGDEVHEQEERREPEDAGDDPVDRARRAAC